jgi:hypothetical protein
VKSNRYRIAITVLGVIALTGLAWILFLPAVKATLDLPGQPTSQPVALPRPVEAYGKLPLSFAANQGQSDQQVRFLARGSNYALFLTGDSAVLALRKSDLTGKGQMATVKSPAGLQVPVPASQTSATNGGPQTNETALWMRVVGANPRATISGQDELPGKSNYFIGNDPKKWHTNVPNYAEVKYASVYPGVDLIYYGNQGQLEYDFVVQPGSDSSRIMLDVGVEPMVAAARPRSAILNIARNGDLVVNADGGEVILQKPTIYQSRGNDGRRTADRQVIEGRYVLVGTHQVGFQVAPYDHSKPLVIDPTLVYSTYLGGNSWQTANGIAVNASGNAYITGKTVSTNFPITAGAFQRTIGGRASDAFITEMNSTGTALVYSTYLGGSSDDEGHGIALDASGDVYVTGWTASSNFPTTTGAFQTTSGGGYDDAFVTKLNPTGSALIYSTYLGGKSFDEGHGIAVDAAGNAYVTGLTYSDSFPTTTGSFQVAIWGHDDAFVTKLNPTGSGLIYSTFLGHSSYDEGRGIAVDALGNAYITGLTSSFNFPVTQHSVQTTWGGGFDAFVSKLNPAGSAMLYSTFLGGGLDDFGYGIAVDASGNAYVTGATYSSNFPTTAGAFQTTPGGISGAGYNDAFVVKLNPTGTAFVYATYLGGSGDEAGNGIAVDASGNASVVGETYSTNFPTTTGALQSTLGGEEDAFFSKLNPAGSALLYSTYLGGTGDDGAQCVALDASGNAYVAGWTNSHNFPITGGAFQTTLPGVQSTFVLQISAQ